MDAEKTIQDFIKENEITAKFTPVSENPNTEHDSKIKQFHFHVVISRPASSEETPPDMMTYYSVGVGIVERWTQKPENKRKVWSYHGVTPIGSGKRSLLSQECFDALAPKYRPEIADILDCLASEASCTCDGQSFEEFASDMGYEEDSRKAESMYNIIKQQSNALKILLGTNAFNELVTDIERL